MPLITNSEPERIVLPSSKDLTEAEQEYVLFDTSPLKGGDISVLDELSTTIDFSIKILPNRIKEWNVRDTNGEVAEITEDNVRRLPVSDMTFLLAKLNQGAGSTDLPKVPEKTSSAS